MGSGGVTGIHKIILEKIENTNNRRGQFPHTYFTRSCRVISCLLARLIMSVKNIIQSNTS